jgi:hypothetical protein
MVFCRPEINYLDKNLGMILKITSKTTGNIGEKLSFMYNALKEVNAYLATKNYGKDLQVLIVSFYSVKQVTGINIPIEKPNYTQRSNDPYLPDFSLVYDILLDNDKYAKESDIKLPLIHDFINSLNVIEGIATIKDFDLESFKSDMQYCFKELGWM